MKRALPIIPAHSPLALEASRPEDRAVRPFIAVWELTLRCDLACRHCGSRAGKPRDGELSTHECLTLVEDLAELGVREVALIGGEVYLREDWLDIIRAIAERGMQPTLVTGGRALTLERAHAARAAGLASASVSIDGSERGHDRLRALDGSHRAALEALANFRAAGVPVGVNTQINRLTWKELGATLERIAAAGARSWQLTFTVPMGRAADDPDLLLQPHDLLEVFPLLAELKTRATELGIDLVGGNNVGYFGPYERLLRDGTEAGYAGSCGAGILTLGIEADGTIKGCPSLATRAWSGGTIRHAPLRAIWERARPLRHMRDRAVSELWGFCATCYYADACRGGCTWMSDSLLGRAGNNPYCHHRALELARVGKRERVERVEAAPSAAAERESPAASESRRAPLRPARGAPRRGRVHSIDGNVDARRCVCARRCSDGVARSARLWARPRGRALAPFRRARAAARHGSVRHCGLAVIETFRPFHHRCGELLRHRNGEREEAR